VKLDGSPGERFRALMIGAQRGDVLSYGELLRELAPWIARFVRLRQPYLTRETVEDVTQEILISLHSVRATYDAARPFLPWLKTIARNRIIDEARRYYRSDAHEVRAGTPPERPIVETTNPSHETYADRAILSAAIRKLPPKQRKAIQLLKIEEMSLIEAQRVTGMSIGSLKVAVHRGIKSLQKLLAAEEIP
jgi:RNA polymerase sigma-70 factor (ECF subfamily)